MEPGIQIRPVQLSDAQAIAAIYAPIVRDTVISFEEVVPGVAEIERRIQEITARHPWLVATGEGGEILGYCYGSPHRTRSAYRFSTEVSIYLDPIHKRRRIGRALYTQLLDELRRLGFARAYAGITLPNPESVGFHESMGFKAIGVYHGVGFKFERWLDVGWWELSLTI